MMFRVHVKVSRHWGMMTDLLRQIKGLGAVVKFPFTGEMFPENGIQRFFDALMVNGLMKRERTGGRM